MKWKSKLCWLYNTEPSPLALHTPIHPFDVPPRRREKGTKEKVPWSWKPENLSAQKKHFFASLIFSQKTIFVAQQLNDNFFYLSSYFHRCYLDSHFILLLFGCCYNKRTEGFKSSTDREKNSKQDLKVKILRFNMCEKDRNFEKFHIYAILYYYSTGLPFVSPLKIMQTHLNTPWNKSKYHPLRSRRLCRSAKQFTLVCSVEMEKIAPTDRTKKEKMFRELERARFARAFGKALSVNIHSREMWVLKQQLFSMRNFSRPHTINDRPTSGRKMWEK